MALRESIQPDSTTPTHDIYDLGDRLLLVASDQPVIAGARLPGLIPSKGEAITRLAVYWYELLESVIGTNLASDGPSGLPEAFAPFADELAGRSLVVAKVEPYPLQAVVYGYLTEAVLDEYQAHGTVGGVESEPGLVLNSPLEQCIYIPFLRGADGALEQADLMRTIELYGNRDGMVLCSNALEIYEIAHGLARARGLIIAEMRVAFGQDGGNIVLTEPPSLDESLLWHPEAYAEGAPQQPFIQQPLLDWLADNGDKPAAELPAEVAAEASRRYIAAFEAISGEDF